MTEYKFNSGKPLCYGAVLTKDGVNFSIYSRDAESVSLCLFESDNSDNYEYFEGNWIIRTKGD